MNFLKNAINSHKRKNKEIKSNIIGKKRKRFVRVGEKNKLQRTQYFSELEEEEKKKRRKDYYKKLSSKNNDDDETQRVELPREEVMILLRKLNEPITLFGESDIDRSKRLRYIQMHGIEEKKSTKIEERFETEDLLKKQEESENLLFKTSEEIEIEKKRLELIEKYYKNTELPAQQPTQDKSEYILLILQRLIKDWEVVIIKTPESMKKKMEFKRERKIHFECKEYIQPLFKRLKDQKLGKDVLDLMYQIVVEIVKRDYVKANSIFLKLSIGNSPWPMGLINVSIHARSSHEKIRTETIAHVLNDETQRKYIQSVKRLMTFAQKRYKSTTRQW